MRAIKCNKRTSKLKWMTSVDVRWLLHFYPRQRPGLVSRITVVRNRFDPSLSRVRTSSDRSDPSDIYIPGWPRDHKPQTGSQTSRNTMWFAVDESARRDRRTHRNDANCAAGREHEGEKDEKESEERRKEEAAERAMSPVKVLRIIRVAGVSADR